MQNEMTNGAATLQRVQELAHSGWLLPDATE